jgi:hypothetical protein
MNHFGNRRNPLQNTDRNELDRIFKLIVDFFHKDWLERKGTHPLQQLWARKDSLSTIELFAFGYSLDKFMKIDPQWLAHQVSQIRNGDENNRRGAFFEILGLGYFDTEKIKIVPAKVTQAGFDGLIEFNNGSSIRLSLKNYGISTHHKMFLQEAKKIEEFLKTLLQTSKLISIHVFIDSPLKYPDHADWKLLHDNLPELIDGFQNKQQLLAIGDSWFVLLNSLDLEGKKFHAGSRSYTLIISSPYHKNEEQNLFSKLDEACYSLSVHSAVEDTKTINFAYIHLPITASVSNCAQWVNDYLSSHSDKPISGVVMYQPSVVVDLESNTTFITHCFLTRHNNRYTEWLNSNGSNSIPIKVPVGRVTQVPTEYNLVIGNKMISVDNRYIFQSGHHYIYGEQRKEGTIEGNISKIASGIFTHLILKPFPNKSEIIISGNFEPEDELIIL